MSSLLNESVNRSARQVQQAGNSNSQPVKWFHYNPISHSVSHSSNQKGFRRENANQPREMILSIECEHWFWVKNNKPKTMIY